MLGRPLFFTAVLSVMSHGNSVEQGLNRTSNGQVNSDSARNATEQLSSKICNPFCETVSHPLPDDVQIDILNNDEKMKRYFNKDVFRDFDLYRSRHSRDPEYVQLCKTLIQFEQPEAAMDVHGTRHFLLNPRKGEYAQRVDVEICQESGLPCAEINDYVSPGTATRCETQFFKRGMVAVNPESLETYEIVVRVPSGCNCFIQKTLLVTS
ncbi:protein spaetzle 5 [Galendromus occidentalis]|uniref:Protein spaetzle 5 n=1 Tax=Galendromus occidentalis TaxID=34638 RepID=A0AAJ6QTI6_9ACAR|nr:protein spaetzle 5 [Galendromus occidentalis]